ncbi:nucleoside-diphosphate sugar epimerase [Pedobacter alpinus]|uniref:Nucleoside-diphosphate sugar epimerase n=1 Tax=Pedobacter alpinus TaxID=1590643 RepID=A0ABW5TWM6_9SPHI
MKEKVILLGASGLIGSYLLPLLLNSDAFEEVNVFVRKRLEMSHPKLKQTLTDFNNLNQLDKDITASQIFCCLGSTKSKTPNTKDYRKVDYDIPLHFAKQGIVSGLKRYHLVSSLGANSKSNNFYTKLKGEIENAIKALPIEEINIYQPSFLRGEREENRPLEKLMLPIMSLVDLVLVGPLQKYKSIEAEDVAKAMFNESIKNKRGIFVHNSEQIKKLV